MAVSYTHLGKILVQSLIATFGTVAIAANAVCNTLCMLPQIPAQAIGLAMTTVIGQCVGAGDYKQASGYIKKLTWMAFLCNGALCVLMLLGAHLIILPFNLSAETAAVALNIARPYYIPVSYTHLDVYKRQESSLSGPAAGGYL